MKYQVVVKLEDQSWDSIQTTKDFALYKSGIYIQKDSKEHVVNAGSKTASSLFSGDGMEKTVAMLEKNGFTVTVKELK